MIKKFLRFLSLCLVVIFLGTSCRKDINQPNLNSVEPSGEQSFSHSKDKNNELKRTIIGKKRNNPYTVENMTKAFKTLYGKDTNLTATHRYIRFKPSSQKHYEKLAKSNLNLYDYPLDHEVIEMGDYYRPENAPENDYYNLYTAAAMDVEIPDVPYDPIEDLYLHSADEQLIRQAISDAGYNPDIEGYIVADPNAGSWNGGGGSTSASGPLVQSADCSCRNGSHQRNPSGCIKVEDTQLSSSGNCNTYMAVRRVKVILKDTWFTEDEVWTDDRGCFTKRNRKYYGKCWMWVKFTNDRGHVRSARDGFNSVWDWLFVVKDYVGTINGPTFNNINVCYDFSNNSGSNAHYFWSAATVYNALHEYYDFAARESLGTPPADLDIYAGRNHSHGYCMMADKLTDRGFLFNNLFMGGVVNIQAINRSIWLSPFYPVAAALSPLTGAIVSFFPDVYVGVEPRNSDMIKEVAYHEFGHAAHYENLSHGFRNHYWIPNVGYIVGNGTSSNPYGLKSYTNSGKCAVIETWGGHIGLTIANAAYGTSASNYCMQGNESNSCINSFFTGSTSSYIQGLEGFNPNLSDDPSSWIPTGILHDLHDFNDESRPILDECNGFNHSDFFNSLNDDVNTVEKFRDRILQNTGNRQQFKVNQLFQRYGY